MIVGQAMTPEVQLATAQTRAFFEERAPTWDAMMPDGLAAALQALLAPYGTKLRQAGRVLEIGTGTGALLPHLVQLVPPERLVSVDLAYAMLVRAHDRVASARLVQGDAHRLPFAGPPHSGFDVIVCHNSFPHYADKRRALAEFKRVLRPGGTLWILHNLPRELVNAVHAQAGGPVAAHVLPATGEMRRLMLESGFVSVEVVDSEAHYVAQGQAH